MAFAPPPACTEEDEATHNYTSLIEFLIEEHLAYMGTEESKTGSKKKILNN